MCFFPYFLLVYGLRTSLQVDRIIFTVFLPDSHQIYSELLHSYFPLEAQKDEEKTVTDKGRDVKVDKGSTKMNEGNGAEKDEMEEEVKDMEGEEAEKEEKEGAQTKESSFEENRLTSVSHGVPILQKSMTEPGRGKAFP